MRRVLVLCLVIAGAGCGSSGDGDSEYADAAGRPTPDFTELGAGEIGGMTLVPGLYKWGSGVTISTDVTLDGGPDDVWIFQISGDVTQASGASASVNGRLLAQTAVTLDENAVTQPSQ